MSEEQAYKKYFREVYLRAEKGERAKNRDERGSLKSNWKPEDLIDKAILVIGENGLGDEVLTIACLSDLENKCKSVSWKCDQNLKKVFSRSFPNVRFLSKKISNLFPDGTVYSWELIGRFRKTLGDFPRNEDAGSFCPYLKPSVPLRDCLSARYNDGAKKVVGLAWRSERDGHILSDKTCDLRDVAHWFAFFDMLRDKVRFVSLQYGLPILKLPLPVGNTVLKFIRTRALRYSITSMRRRRRLPQWIMSCRSVRLRLIWPELSGRRAAFSYKLSLSDTGGQEMRSAHGTRT